MFCASTLLPSSCLPLPPDAEMDTEDAAGSQPGPGRGGDQGPLMSTGPAGSRQGRPGPFPERIRVSVRRSASRGGLSPELTGMLAILPERQRASFLVSVGQGK